MPPRVNSFGNTFFHINEDWDTLSEYPNIADITSLGDWLTLFHTTPIYRRLVAYEPNMNIGDYLVIGSKPSSVFSDTMMNYLNSVVEVDMVSNRDNFRFKSVVNPLDDWIGRFTFDNECIDKNKSYYLQQLLNA